MFCLTFPPFDGQLHILIKWRCLSHHRRCKIASISSSFDLTIHPRAIEKSDNNIGIIEMIATPPSIDRRGNLDAPFFVGFQFKMSGSIAGKSQEETYGRLCSSQLPGFSIQMPSLRCSL